MESIFRVALVFMYNDYREHVTKYFFIHSVRTCRLSVRACREPTVILDKLPITCFFLSMKVQGFVRLSVFSLYYHKIWNQQNLAKKCIEA